MGSGTGVESTLPGMPTWKWSSRVQMMRARAQAVDECVMAHSVHVAGKDVPDVTAVEMDDPRPSVRRAAIRGDGEVTVMGNSAANSALPGMPPQEWSSRAEMMRARARAVDELENAASHDWRRLVAGAMSLVLVLGGELLFLGIIGPATDLGWEPAAFVLGVPAILALVGGGASAVP
jgi:hypothetical protein